METGIKGRAELTVVFENTALAAGSGRVEVFSTPSMIALMERAAGESVQPYLEQGQTTVGIRVEADHLAGAPIGSKVWAESELIEINKRIMTFKVSAYTEVEKIGEGLHKRCIVSSETFMEKAKAKYWDMA